MPASGVATLDFGATPSDYTSVDVAGQGTILTTSMVEPFIMGATTGDSDEEDHLMAIHNMRVVADIPTAGTGFTIHAFVVQGLTKGSYRVNWAWN